MTVMLRDMRLSDVAAVRALEQRTFATTWQESAFENELKNNPTAIYLVLEDGGLLGYAGFWVVDHEAHVTSIALDSTRRGQGLGKRLMLAMVRRALEAGACWMTLEVRADNRVAQNLYRRFGFYRVGIRPRYYENSVDAWIMWAGNLASESYQQRLLELEAGVPKP
jgi:ribosomal-protein-alanine N-acetyltransferase